MARFLLLAFLTLTLIAISLVLYRIRAILDANRPRPRLRGRNNPEDPTHLLVVLGSGGHTAEMLSMLSRAVNSEDTTTRLRWTDFTHRTWIIGTGDEISVQRAGEFEEMAIEAATQDTDSSAGTSVIVTVPRAREIHQSLFTAPVSCLRCLVACCVVLLRHGSTERGFPDLVLCNGPATATILVLATFLLRFFNVMGCHGKGEMRIIYVESWARVKKLSLSGMLLSTVVDRFLVQWPQLEKNTGGRGEYLGVLA